jgi:catechol 2,3-dioxygenase-like lactoylglutathione lyase family enzyme
MIHTDFAFDHCGFVTTDLDATVAFWRDAVGLRANEIVERTGDWVASFTGVPGGTLRIVHLFGEGVHLEFLEFTGGAVANQLPAPSMPCTGHICLRVDDAKEALAQMEAAGGKAEGRVTKVTEGAIAGVSGLYLRDPNGLLVELLERPRSEQ